MPSGQSWPSKPSKSFSVIINQKTFFTWFHLQSLLLNLQKSKTTFPFQATKSTLLLIISGLPDNFSSTPFVKFNFPIPRHVFSFSHLSQINMDKILIKMLLCLLILVKIAIRILYPFSNITFMFSSNYKTSTQKTFSGSIFCVFFLLIQPLPSFSFPAPLLFRCILLKINYLVSQSSPFSLLSFRSFLSFLSPHSLIRSPFTSSSLSTFSLLYYYFKS